MLSQLLLNIIISNFIIIISGSKRCSVSDYFCTIAMTLLTEDVRMSFSILVVVKKLLTAFIKLLTMTLLIKSSLRLSVYSWTCNWGRLTTLLSIFLFLTHLFIRLNVSVYILMIYKWSKIRAWWWKMKSSHKNFSERVTTSFFFYFALFF